MYNANEKIKFKVSGVLKDLNRRYHRNYTTQDVGDKIGVTRETISRITSDSSFSLIYKLAVCLYEFYPEYNDGEWDFCLYANLLSYDDCSFIL